MDDRVSVKTDFLEGLDSQLHIKSKYDSKELNYTWLEMYEQSIPYIDNFLRNPKRFIINEEEIVKVEKAKKVTVESVIHLTQHTNLIEDYNVKTGEVRPAKILNINKEESLDTYENRFVHTLIKNMRMFYDRHADALGGGSYFLDSKNAEYSAITKMGTEEVKMEVKYESYNKSSLEEEGNNSQESVESRLRAIKIRLDGFMGTDLMVTLDRLHVADVTSPIRKTNAILKNPNLQICTRMWNYIQSYMQDDSKEERAEKDYMDNGDIKSQFDQSFMFNYIALSSLSKANSVQSEKKVISLTLSRVIENILDMNDEILESKIKEVFKEEFKTAQTAVGERNKKIVDLFNQKLKKENDKIFNATNTLGVDL